MFVDLVKRINRKEEVGSLVRKGVRDEVRFLSWRWSWVDGVLIFVG